MKETHFLNMTGPAAIERLRLMQTEMNELARGFEVAAPRVEYHEPRVAQPREVPSATSPRWSLT